MTATSRKLFFCLILLFTFVGIASASLSNYDSNKQLNATFVSGTPTISKAQPVYWSCNSTTTESYEIAIDCSGVDGVEDVAFVDENGNDFLPYEHESFDSSSGGVSWVYDDWVRDGNLDGYIAYGNGVSDQQNVSATWENTGAVMVQHFEDDPLNAFDSTSFANDGAVNDATSTNGIFDGAASFDGSNDDIVIGQDSSIDDLTSGEMTVVGWIEDVQDGGGEKPNPKIATYNNDFTTWWGIGINEQGTDDSEGNVRWEYDNGNSISRTFSNTVVSDQGTYLVGGTRVSGGQQRVWVNGNSEDSVSTVSDFSATHQTYIGESGTGGEHFQGTIDAFRLYLEAQNSTWWEAEYDASREGGQTFFDISQNDTFVDSEKIQYPSHEDGDIDEFQGDKDVFSVVEDPEAFDGDYVLDVSQSTEENNVIGTYQLNASTGDTLEGYAYTDDSNGRDAFGFGFGFQDANNIYYVSINDQTSSGLDELLVEKIVNGSSSVLCKNEFGDYPSGEWVRVTINWNADESVDATVYDTSDGSEIASLNCDASNFGEFTSGGIGYRSFDGDFKYDGLGVINGTEEPQVSLENPEDYYVYNQTESLSFEANTTFSGVAESLDLLLANSTDQYSILENTVQERVLRDSSLWEGRPVMERLDNGNILMLYRQGNEHNGRENSYPIVCSTDNGSTWGNNGEYCDGSSIEESPLGNRSGDDDRGLINFDLFENPENGNLVTNTWTVKVDSNNDVVGTDVSRGYVSEDNGETWSYSGEVSWENTGSINADQLNLGHDNVEYNGSVYVTVDVSANADNWPGDFYGGIAKYKGNNTYEYLTDLTQASETGTFEEMSVAHVGDGKMTLIHRGSYGNAWAQTYWADNNTVGELRDISSLTNDRTLVMPKAYNLKGDNMAVASSYATSFDNRPNAFYIFNNDASELKDYVVLSDGTVDSGYNDVQLIGDDKAVQVGYEDSDLEDYRFDLEYSQEAGDYEVVASNSSEVQNNSVNSIDYTIDSLSPERTLFWNMRLTQSDGQTGTADTDRRIEVQESTEDTTAPTSSDNWTASGFVDKSSATVELTASDSGSGVEDIYYRVNGGSYSVVQGSSATVTISSQGNNTLEYYAEDSAGNVEATNTEYVALQTNSAPSASFTTSTTDLTVNVDGSGSSDSDGSISSYEWDWTNDGTYEGSGETQSHTYGSEGTYNVKLRVTDDDGAVDTQVKTVSVSSGTDDGGDGGGGGGGGITDTTPPDTIDNWDVSGFLDKTQAAVSLSATDAGVGVDRIEYQINGNGFTSVSGNSASVDIFTQGNNTLEYYAVDNNGNEEQTQTEYVAFRTSTDEGSDGDDGDGSQGTVSLQLDSPQGDIDKDGATEISQTFDTTVDVNNSGTLELQISTESQTGFTAVDGKAIGINSDQTQQFSETFKVDYSNISESKQVSEEISYRLEWQGDDGYSLASSVQKFRYINNIGGSGNNATGLFSGVPSGLGVYLLLVLLLGVLALPLLIKVRLND